MNYCNLFLATFLLSFLVGCNPAVKTLNPMPQVTTLETHNTPTLPLTSTTIPQPTQISAPFPLSQPGPYSVGTHQFKSLDISRNNREVSITIWYPAIHANDSTSTSPILNATPDLTGKPYPLLLSSTKVAQIFAPDLVSHGFAWASVDNIDSYMAMNEQMIDQPEDILFALDQVGSNPPASLEGVIDSTHTGVLGYSFDGYNTLALSGARIDPEYYLAQCPEPDLTTKNILSGMSAFDCSPAGEWDKFTAHAGEDITANQDGLWQALTDDRIRAVMPMAGEGWWLFGEKGLASVDRPVLIIVARQDELYPENTLIFEHLGTSDKTLISFTGQNHMMIYDKDMVARMTHFAAAFFGYHLQGRQDLAYYFSEDFVVKNKDLQWYQSQTPLLMNARSRCPRWWYRKK